jgi:hypothetical protein
MSEVAGADVVLGGLGRVKRGVQESQTCVELSAKLAQLYHTSPFVHIETWTSCI